MYYAPTVRSDELYHYGRLGMHWYQHIYGPVQSVAKYAKKAAGATSKAAGKAKEAYSEHKEKSEAKTQEKIESAIRSGDAKKVSKYAKKMSDEQIRRADYRISEETKISDLANPKRVEKRNQDKAVQNFVNKASKKTINDYVNDAVKIVNTADTVMNTIDKANKVTQRIKDATPEAKARKKELNDIVKNLDFEGFTKNFNSMDDNQISSFKKRLDNVKNIANTYASNSSSGKHDSMYWSRNDSGGKKSKNVSASDISDLDDYMEDFLRRYKDEE